LKKTKRPTIDQGTFSIGIQRGGGRGREGGRGVGFVVPTCGTEVLTGEEVQAPFEELHVGG